MTHLSLSRYIMRGKYSKSKGREPFLPFLPGQLVVFCMDCFPVAHYPTILDLFDGPSSGKDF